MSVDRGFELVRELTRSTETIPPFNDNGLRSVLEDINKIFENNHENAISYHRTGEQRFYPVVMYRHFSIQRQKRCALVYLYNRLQKLKKIRWHLGATLPADIKANLNDYELQWYNNYSKILANYMMTIGDGQGLNLTNDIKPPKSLFIEVRCLVDYGKFELESGEIILLKKNSQHYLPKLQCESLIRQGILQHIV
ncbi:DNA replication complex GINS protein PSF1-like [Toxorhynchites rutilus septentrionalis]|uniref:DNA replication complex GINS protein PSF1-like n=1 Tax=Toxorhynchites rutilus septentrionalis TaxID=329112 RepID=UPI002478D820|nr:DNA replication complex GINS protein PSF1-like [Toxorhynchites rutilus septentrionalis]